ncbi:MAG: T9SS type A sorting domain-containing protein [Chitinophagaceae bacterium]
MKKNLTLLFLNLLLGAALQAQISNAVRGTIVSEASNQVTVYARSTVALTDKHVDNVVLSFSIVDPGAGFRPTASIITNHLADVTWVAGVGSPYAEGGRYHYDFIATNSISTPSVSTINWNVGQSYPLLTIGLSNSTGFASARLDHWDAPNFGANFNSQWYFQIQQSGSGDITAQTNLFYGEGTEVNAPGGWVSGTSYAPLQPLTVIPVRFVSFSATKNNNDALLNWKVDNEDIKTDRYEVERSINAVNFTSIATVAKKTNGLANNSYDLTDINITSLAVSSNAVIYYRIKQIDKDGRFIYSETKNIRLNGFKGFNAAVFPNPVKTTATINIDLIKADNVFVIVTDAAGKEVQKLSFAGAIGGNTKSINMSNLSAGTYLVKVVAGEEIKSFPLVKTN